MCGLRERNLQRFMKKRQNYSNTVTRFGTCFHKEKKNTMVKPDIDILMITFNRPEYTRLSLERLLTTCDERMRVWIWQNGNDEGTLQVVRSFAGHSHVFEFHHSPENKKLREPINWLWTHAKGDFLCKVDDDCLMPYGWADVLRQAHANVPEFGVIGCWVFPEEDFVSELAYKKIKTFPSGHQIMQNCWVGGSGFLMKRACVEENGLLQPGESLTRYCIRLALAGWINGWYYPFLHQEHMDDPRSVHSCLRTDEDLKKWMPLSAKYNGVTTLDEWRAQLKRSACFLQQTSIDPRHYIGWRKMLRGINRRIKRLFRIKRQW